MKVISSILSWVLAIGLIAFAVYEIWSFVKLIKIKIAEKKSNKEKSQNIDKGDNK